MPRLGRVVVPGIPHHIAQRGVRREDVFYSQEDRWRYLEHLAQAAEQFGVAVWSWCLMTNHVHVVAVPEDERSFALCFGKAHTQYTRMINFRKDWRGHLWQSRFGSSPMDDGYTYHTVRYVLVGRPLGQFVTQLEQDLNPQPLPDAHPACKTKQNGV